MDLGTAHQSFDLDTVSRIPNRKRHTIAPIGPALAANMKVRSQLGCIEAGALNVGDLIYTRDNGLQPIRYVTHFDVSDGENELVVFTPGAFGNSSTLRVSADQSILCSSWQTECLFGGFEMLAPARGLVNGSTVYTVSAGVTTMVQIVLDAHHLLFAGDIPVESLHPSLAQPETSLKSLLAIDSLSPAVRPKLTVEQARHLAPRA